MNKKRYFNFILIIVLGFALTPSMVMAQNTVSPYSIFGPGEIQYGGFGASRGMGGAGIALESGNYLNSLNPASYTGIDTLRIISEFGLEGKLYDISTSSQSVSGFEGNLAYVALGFKYTNWLAGSFGMTPFSNVGYSIYRTNYVEGMNSQYISNYEGSGGITRFYFSNAIRFLKKLSVGVNMSYMFGTLIQEEYITGSSIVPDMMIERKDYLRSLYFDVGLQYKFKVANTDCSFGLTYAPEQILDSEHIVTAYDESSNAVQTEEDTDEDYEELVVPHLFGAGIGITGERYKLALDYNLQLWSGVEYPIQADEFKNSHRFALGLEVNPWEHRAINAGYKNWTYRMGASYESSYLTFGNTTLDTKEITLGVGIPLYGALSNVDFSITGGTYGTTANNLSKENYLVFNVGFSLNEIAFLKRVID